MSSFVWRSLTVVGVLALLHSLLSAAQIQSAQEGSLPFDIIVECLFGALLSSFAFVKLNTIVQYDSDGITVSKSSPQPGLIVDGWKNIDASKAIASSKITVESINNRSNFAHFNHRAKFLYNDSASASK
ncbi:hypothetical protein C9374_012086 [Naegleria lovaniensis]|uniref:Membrane magnesium transporter n=1 Tax=Naegleria lovaniensis TaxID=51637 RepID=A0AA88GDE3_NAELO|nr:uncharacterized protein C9374_012086 [Naegleria lovaniensis]KAG2373479.1 hypothetical protein C9374_012086 [Naegleria lovaniensis]